KAHRAGHGLPVNECRRIWRFQEALAMRLRRLDEEAEKGIVLDADLGRLGKRTIFPLQFGDDPPALVAQGAGFVERRLSAFTYEAAVAFVERQIVGERL